MCIIYLYCILCRVYYIIFFKRTDNACRVVCGVHRPDGNASETEPNQLLYRTVGLTVQYGRPGWVVLVGEAEGVR